MAALVVAVVVPASAAAFDPVVEALNLNKGNERQTIYDTPRYTALLAQVSLANENGALTAQAADPEREFQTDLCARGENGCAGDARLYDWGPKGYGALTPVLFTASNADFGSPKGGQVFLCRTTSQCGKERLDPFPRRCAP